MYKHRSEAVTKKAAMLQNYKAVSLFTVAAIVFYNVVIHFISEL